jgi:putative DNA primase/helicase
MNSLAREISAFYNSGKAMPAGKDNYLAKCPVHGDENPSLSVTDTSGGDDVVVNCHVGCDFKDIKDRFRQDGLLPEWKPDPGHKQAGKTRKADPGPPPPEKESFIWKQASKEGLDHARKYFANRAITTDLPVCFKWNSYTDKKTGETSNMIVAAASKPEDTAVYAVQRLFIDLENHKKAGAKMHGPCDGRGIWFDRKGDMAEIVAGEGIETVLSAMQATGKNGVACLSTAGMKNLIIPEETERLYIIPDSDPIREKEAASMPGQKAAVVMAERFTASRPGRQAFIVSPDDTCFSGNPVKMDFNDLLVADPSGESIRARFEKAVELKDLDWTPPVAQPGWYEQGAGDVDNKFFENLLERVVDDCGAVYEPEAVEAISRLRASDKAEFMRLRARLKKANSNVLLGELGKDIRSFSRVKNESSSTPGTLLTLSSSYPSRCPALKDKVLHFKDALVREDENDEKALCPQSETALLLAEQLQGHYAHEIEVGCWYRFNGTHWREVKQLEVDEAITALLYAGAGELGFANSYQSGAASLLQKGGILSLGERAKGKIPFENGLLDLKSKKLEPVTYENALTWSLPFPYDSNATCNNFLKWLGAALDGDRETVNLLRAFLNATLTGRPDLQRFLHLIGPAGTGKSTFGRLAFAIVGTSNSTTTTLRQLEQNRFETAGFYGKRLVCIEDADKYGGSVSTLKAMTGQDPLRHERKNQQQSGNYIYDGQVLMMSNERLATTDYTSGIERRRVTVEFTRRITAEERAEWERRGGEEAILHAEIPGIVNWALGLSRDEVTEAFKVMPKRVQRANLDAALFNNPLADWLVEHCIPDPGAKTQIGDGRLVASLSGEKTFINADERLYPNYLLWCQRSGREKVSLQRFSAHLKDAALQFGAVTRKVRTGSLGTHFEGLRLRRDDEKMWKDLLESGSSPTLVQEAVQDNYLKTLKVKKVEGSTHLSYAQKTHTTNPTKNEIEVEI